MKKQIFSGFTPLKTAVPTLRRNGNRGNLSLTGFTLIELLVVVITIGILAAIAIPIYTNIVNEQKARVTVNNIQMIIAAEKIYRFKNGIFWPDPGPLTVSDQEINTQLGTEISENNFIWGSKDYYFINGSPTYFEIRTRSGWTSPTLYMVVYLDLATNTINWQYASTYGFLDWFDAYPNTLPE